MRTMALTLGLLSVVMISGCSSTQTASYEQRLVVDREYMAAVEAASKRSITPAKIYWVNPPTKYVVTKTEGEQP
ncbi:hypothetical protein CWI71_09965 [Pseudidiomarina insulisalsae]|uniref:Uncharacterized protein n=2 Tax=Pseudidiomarina insulisalsae TaxID=575789 RepID=A0A432YCT7_9GAMM|nr:hypothetical protein CWI71_09965 [Pseudidiomarina insulisalsae]